MDTPNLIPIQKDQESIIETVLTNIVKMLTNRKELEFNDLHNNIKNLINQKPDNYTYTIKTINNEKIVIKLLLQTITTVSKTSPIYEFLVSDSKNKNIIVVKSITNTPLNIIHSRYKHIELFLEKDLMIDKVSCNIVPRVGILSEEEKEEFFTQYNVTKQGCLKISYKDPIVKYYDANVGDILRIIRPSPTSAFTVSYRLIVKKEL